MDFIHHSTIISLTNYVYLVFVLYLFSTRFFLWKTTRNQPQFPTRTPLTNVLPLTHHLFRFYEASFESVAISSQESFRMITDLNKMLTRDFYTCFIDRDDESLLVYSQLVIYWRYNGKWRWFWLLYDTRHDPVNLKTEITKQLKQST